ncbi:S41 family peptidase, partial [Xanthovirga aplysinae]|uniref:S41 family peptidase n=1 Tax=Xanthovirga aplysinae TaxID=2529853 RepID=UPI0012BC75D0
MKKITFLSFFLSFIALVPGNSQTKADQEVSGENIPEELKRFLDKMEEPLEIKELPDYILSKPPKTITKRQALEDVEMIQYLFDNVFSGRYYWQHHGVDFPKAYADLKSWIEYFPIKEISTLEFQKRIYNALKNINDPHTAIIGEETWEFFTRVRQYFTHLIIEKRGNKYIVIESDQPSIPVGTLYLDKEEYLRKTLSKEGVDQFLLGIMSTEKPTELSVNFSSGAFSLPLHPCKIGNIKYDRFKNIIETDTIENIPYVRSSSFWVEEEIKTLENFTEIGKELKNAPVFIWNLLANDGGISTYPHQFIENFNGLAQEESWLLYLHSTAIIQAYFPKKNRWSSWPKEWLDDNTPLDSIPEYKHYHVKQIRKQKKELIENPKKYWEIVRKKPEKKYGNYKGKVIILSNYRNGSAGNNALAASKSIPNSLIVGEQSNMTYTFANTRQFCLKNSSIKFRLPGRLIIHPENNVDQGFLPDLWLDSEKPVEEIVKWL